MSDEFESSGEEDFGIDLGESRETDPFNFDRVEENDWTPDYNWVPDIAVGEDERGILQRIEGRPSDIAQGIFWHLGRPLRLDNHAFYLPVYNGNHRRIVLKCGRQVAKSTTIAILQVLESVLRPYWRSLYVSPSTLQTRQYSNEKLRPTIYDSPFVKQYFTGKGLIDQVMEKTLSNGSYMFLRYAFLSPARARGIPASRVFFDEAQDILKDNIKIISQSLSASRLAMGVPGSELISGTPLTLSNTLEEYWKWSTQNEWLIPCDCKSPVRYWNLLGENNIGKAGLVCSNCYKPIDPRTGQWVSMAPEEFYQGFHITQLMVPWKQSEEAWQSEILMPFKKWPTAKVYNEIFGESYDSASNPVTRADIERLCYPVKQLGHVNTRRFRAQRDVDFSNIQLFAGVDWGEGREEGGMQGGKKRYASFTILTIGGYVQPNLFWPVFMKRYTGQEIDPEFIIKDVLNIIGRFNCVSVGLDWGHGWGMNSRIFQARGRERAMQFNYSTSLGERKKWDPDGYKWIINRNALLARFFEDVKAGKFIFPEWAEFESFAEDILAEYREYNERTKTMMFDHPLDQPDDALHSLCYAKLAADITLGFY